jgi:SNF2 family DNA or RNA helicase
MVEWAAAHHKRLVIAINYESARSEPFATWALSRVWPMVIADESHRLKDPGGRTSRWAARLGLQTRYRLALTGTPMAHEPLDIWGQFRFLDPSILDRTYGSFKLRHAVMGGYYGKEIVAWKDLDELNQKFYSIAYRVTDEVLDLPAELDQTLSTELAPGVAKIYRDMERDLVAWIAEGVAVTAANALVRLLRLQQITGGTLTTEEGDPYHIDCAKEDLLADFLSDVGDEPVVVFARFTSDLAAIRHACEREKLLCGELSGHSGDRDLLAWQRGSKYDPTVLAVQIQTGSSGISLTRARIAIYYSIGYSLTDYLQSRARIRRPPQNRPCVYYHLVIQNSIDEIVLRAVRARHNLIESALEELKK